MDFWLRDPIYELAPPTSLAVSGLRTSSASRASTAVWALPRGPTLPSRFPLAAHQVSPIARALASRATSAATSTARRRAGRGTSRKKKDVYNNFDVVVLHSEPARQIFQEVVRQFECPEERPYLDWLASRRMAWEIFKDHLGDRALDQGTELPVLAMNGDIPCAAAFFANADMSRSNAVVLSFLIRNAGAACKGGGAAILCYFIRNSIDNNSQPTPLELAPIAFDFHNINLGYLQYFGCTGDHEILRCHDPNPKICKRHANEIFDAESYWDFSQRIDPAELEPLTAVSRSMHSPSRSPSRRRAKNQPLQLAVSSRKSLVSSQMVIIFVASIIGLFGSCGGVAKTHMELWKFLG